MKFECAQRKMCINSRYLCVLSRAVDAGTVYRRRAAIFLKRGRRKGQSRKVRRKRRLRKIMSENDVWLIFGKSHSAQQLSKGEHCSRVKVTRKVKTIHFPKQKNKSKISLTLFPANPMNSNSFMTLAGSIDIMRLKAPTPILVPDSKSERKADSDQEVRSFRALQHSLKKVGKRENQLAGKQQHKVLSSTNSFKAKRFFLKFLLSSTYVSTQNRVERLGYFVAPIYASVGDERSLVFLNAHSLDWYSSWLQRRHNWGAPDQLVRAPNEGKLTILVHSGTVRSKTQRAGETM